MTDFRNKTDAELIAIARSKVSNPDFTYALSLELAARLEVATTRPIPGDRRSLLPHPPGDSDSGK